MKKEIVKSLEFLVMTVMIIVAIPVFASSTSGIIDNNHKYAWSENVGWINFKTDNGNISITDSELSGYAWSSGYGWINLSPPTSGVNNDGSGNLSGYAWGENVGWIDFSGVAINSDGYFSGYANSVIAGQISFNCSNTDSCANSDFKLRTDWRPREERPICNNATDDDNDGLTDYPADPGCSSLDDEDETDPGSGLPPSAYNSPLSPPPSSNNPGGVFSVVINNNDEYTNNKTVLLKLTAGENTARMAISNSIKFVNASQIPFQENMEWEINNSGIVYARFYTKYGYKSQTVSDSIILDNIAPKIKITGIKDYYDSAEDVILIAKTEANAEVVLYWDEKYGLAYADGQGELIMNLGKMPAGDYRLELFSIDLAGNKGDVLFANLIIKKVKKTKEISENQENKPIEQVQQKFYEPIISPKNKFSEELIEKISKFFEPVFPKFPKSKPKKPKEIITIPKKTPLVMRNQWNLFPQEQINEFVLAPLPKGLKRLAKKFPKLQETFDKVGIDKITDLKKLRNSELSLPGLSKYSLFSKKELALLKNIPLSKLPSEIKNKIPSEMIFARIGDEKSIDFDIKLNISDQGKIQQRINAISGQKLILTVRPERKAKSVYGYLAFTERKNQKFSFQNEIPKNKFCNLFNSIIFAKPVFAENYANEVEEEFISQKFSYADKDNDGLWIAEIVAPIVEGEYEVITLIEYEDPDLGTRMIRLTTIVDPEGYVYEMIKDQELRIRNATVSIYQLNSESDEYELWQADNYRQKNPQTTDATGRYSFLVPEGTYYLAVEAADYSFYQSEPFTIQEGFGIHQNIKLKSKNAWLKIIDWKVIAILLLFVLVVWNFWRDKKRSFHNS